MSQLDDLLKGLADKDKEQVKSFKLDSLYEAFDSKTVKPDTTSPRYKWIIPAIATSFFGLLIISFLILPTSSTDTALPEKITVNAIKAVELNKIYTVELAQSLQFNDQHKWQLGEETEIKVLELNTDKAVVHLVKGEIEIRKEDNISENNRIRIKNIEITEIGTHYKVSHKKAKVVITVYSGEVLVEDKELGEKVALLPNDQFKADIIENKIKLSSKKNVTASEIKKAHIKPRWEPEFNLAKIKAMSGARKAWLSENEVHLYRGKGSLETYPFPDYGVIESIFLGSDIAFLKMNGEYHNFLSKGSWISQRLGKLDQSQIYVLGDKVGAINHEGKYLLYSKDGDLLDSQEIGGLLWSGVVYKHDFLILPSIYSPELIIIDNSILPVKITHEKTSEIPTSDLTIDGMDILIPISSGIERLLINDFIQY